MLLTIWPLSVAGCGNGKYLHINKEVFKLGCDVCRPLVDFAWSQGHEVQVCDGLQLPYIDGCFDAVLSIAGKPTDSLRRRCPPLGQSSTEWWFF